jgi:hypothetical protein
MISVQAVNATDNTQPRKRKFSEINQLPRIDETVHDMLKLGKI